MSCSSLDFGQNLEGRRTVADPRVRQPRTTAAAPVVIVTTAGKLKVCDALLAGLRVGAKPVTTIQASVLREVVRVADMIKDSPRDTRRGAARARFRFSIIKDSATHHVQYDLPDVLVHHRQEMAALYLAGPRESKVRDAEEVHPRKARREGLTHVVGHDIHAVIAKLRVVGPEATVRAVHVPAKRRQGRHGSIEFSHEVIGVIVPDHGVDVRQLLRVLSPG